MLLHSKRSSELAGRAALLEGEHVSQTSFQSRAEPKLIAIFIELLINHNSLSEPQAPLIVVLLGGGLRRSGGTAGLSLAGFCRRGR